MIRPLLSIPFLFLGAGMASAADLALVGGDVHTVSGAMLPGATVLIRGEKILLVGPDVPVPKGARTIDCKGMIVTPGLIESDSSLGLVEIDLVEETVDAYPRLGDPVRAAVRAADAVDMRSTLIGVARRHGVTSAVSAPGGGLISGRSAWIDLLDPRSTAFSAAVQRDVAMTASLGELGAGASGGSRAVAVARLREALDDARTYQRSKAAFGRRALYELSISRLDAEALQAVLTRQMPLVVRVSRASDIRTVLRTAKEERISVVLLGAEEGWLVADEIARAKVPVILDAFENLPHRFESRHARADNAALLAAAGVKVAVATRSSHNASMLRFALGNAVRAGLPAKLALRAATLTPAEIFGKGGSHGSLDRGKVANVVVWTGDPFQPKSHAAHVIVRGEVQPTASRQTALAEKHARRLGLVP